MRKRMVEEGKPEEIKKIKEINQNPPNVEEVKEVKQVIPASPTAEPLERSKEVKPIESGEIDEVKSVPQSEEMGPSDIKPPDETKGVQRLRNEAISETKEKIDNSEAAKETTSSYAVSNGPKPFFELRRQYRQFKATNKSKRKNFDFRISFQKFPQRIRLDKKVGYVAVAAAVLFLTILPFYMGTVTYPLAIVNGNSMYPNLHNGDLVLFQAPTNPNAIPNGTIVVYVNTETGVTGLDALTRPIVIHRVIAIAKQSDGSVDYETKGDNNLVPDPELVPSNHVIGTPVLDIPYVGLAFLFIQSPQGLVAAIGIITILYLAKYEGESKEEKKKEAFLAALARMSLNSEITESLFKRLELTVKYFGDLKINDLTDVSVVALVDWLKRGGLEKGWKLEDLACPECGAKARAFESKNELLLIICPTCNSQ